MSRNRGGRKYRPYEPRRRIDPQERPSEVVAGEGSPAEPSGNSKTMPINAVFTRENLARMTGDDSLVAPMPVLRSRSPGLSTIATENNAMSDAETLPKPHIQPRHGSVIVEEGVPIDIRSAEPNDLAIRLWQLDQATMHLTRNAAALGLAGNMVQQSLRDEKDKILRQLQSLVEGFQQ